MLRFGIGRALITRREFPFSGLRPVSLFHLLCSYLRILTGSTSTKVCFHFVQSRTSCTDPEAQGKLTLRPQEPVTTRLSLNLGKDHDIDDTVTHHNSLRRHLDFHTNFGIHAHFDYDQGPQAKGSADLS